MHAITNREVVNCCANATMYSGQTPIYLRAIIDNNKHDADLASDGWMLTSKEDQG